MDTIPTPSASVWMNVVLSVVGLVGQSTYAGHYRLPKCHDKLQPMKRAVSVLNIYSRGCVPSHNRVCSAWMVSASGPNFNRPRGQSRVRGRDYMCHLWKRCANLTLVTLQSLIEAVKSGKRTGKTNNRVVNYYGNRIISCKPPILIVIGDQGDIIENTTIGILSGKKAICKRKERPHRVQPNEKISPETARRDCVNRII